jgi:hypothetical protein
LGKNHGSIITSKQIFAFKAAQKKLYSTVFLLRRKELV